MDELFQKVKSTIKEHIKNSESEWEVDLSTMMRKFGISELSTKPTNYYCRVQSNVRKTHITYKKKKMNNRELQHYYVKDSHTSIISSGIFDTSVLEKGCKTLKSQLDGINSQIKHEIKIMPN